MPCWRQVVRSPSCPRRSTDRLDRRSIAQTVSSNMRKGGVLGDSFRNSCIDTL
jgi:hypothetical protein